MSIIVADTLKSRAGSAVTTTGGLNVGGATTIAGAVVATTLAGDGSSITALSGSNISSGTVAAARLPSDLNTTGTAGGLTGTPNIAVGNITGVAATFTGVLTYEDVTNVDSVGIVTARSGIEFGAAGVGGTITALGHGEFVGIVTASGLDAAISVWTLGASGTSHYTFTGPGDLGGDSDPDLQLIRGQKYIFKNRSGGHPFRIQSTVNGSTGTAYNDGVTNNDGGNGTDIIFDVPFDAPSVLYYQCTSHAAMGGVIYIGSSSGDDVNVGSAITMYASSGIVSATSFHGDGSSLSGLSGGFSSMVALTSGTSWSIPAGVTKIKVHCTGAGGGGGYGTSQKAGGSGGAGGTSIHYFDTSGGGSATYAIGAGGAKSTGTSASGTTGGDSTFAYGGTTITGSGGIGGGSSSDGSHAGTACGGGAGGAASGGTLNLPGGSGSSGQQNTDGAERVSPLLAGASFWGGTGRPGGIESSSNGPTPANIGCGGVGGKNWNGNDGSDGLIVIEY